MNPRENVPVGHWLTSRGPARCQELVVSKMQKRRMQRMEADASNNGVKAQWAQPNPRRE